GVIADRAGDEWPEKARQAATSLSASAEENNPISSLLLDIFVVFTMKNAEKLFTGTCWRASTVSKTDRGHRCLAFSACRRMRCGFLEWGLPACNWANRSGRQRTCGLRNSCALMASARGLCGSGRWSQEV